MFHKPCWLVIHTYMGKTPFYQSEDVTGIENVSNKEFSYVCKWFVDNRLPIHSGEDKTKRILFSKSKYLSEINITYNNNRVN